MRHPQDFAALEAAAQRAQDMGRELDAMSRSMLAFVEIRRLLALLRRQRRVMAWMVPLSMLAGAGMMYWFIEVLGL